MGKDRAFTLNLDQVDDLNYELSKLDTFIYSISLMEGKNERLGTLTNLLWETHGKISSILKTVLKS